jgi:hypothetical protein
MKVVEFESKGPPEEFTKGQRGHLRIESVSKLLSEPDPPIEWLIEGLWTDKSKGLIAGHPGVGKTWIALDMLLSVASGLSCMGKYPVRHKGGALLIEEEASRRNLQRRIHAMARGRGLKDHDLTNFYHMTAQFAKIPKDTNEIITIIKANDIKLVVFDSLRRFHSAKENSSDDMQPVLEGFQRISVIGNCSVVLIHHLSKSGNEMGKEKSIFERMRGTGDLWSWRDCIIGVEGEEDAEIAKCSFQFRDAESPMPIQVKRCVGALTGAIALEALDLSEAPEFIAKCEAAKAYLLTVFGSAFLSAIAKDLEGRKADNLKAVKLMVKKGILVPKEEGKYGVP